MKRLFFLGLRWCVLPALLLLGTVTGGVDGYVGWFVLAWMLWRGGPAMWQDVKFVCRWFFSFRFRLPSRFRSRSSNELNV